MSPRADLPQRAVVLAAGRGSRLGALTDQLPKTCQPLGATDLLGRQCAQLAARGIHDVTVVTGHAAPVVAARHAQVRTIVNADWARTGSGTSLLCARAAFAGDEPVLLTHGDLVYDDRMLDALLDAAAQGHSAAVLDGSWRVDTGDEVVGWSDTDGRLAGVRKGAPDPSAAAAGEFVGLSVWQPEVAAAFVEFCAPRDPREDYEQPRLHDFVGAGGAAFFAVLVHALPWWNVNHPADLQAARARFDDGGVDAAESTP